MVDDAHGFEDRHRRGNELWDRAGRLIPGGSQLLSKRPEIYAPDCWPAYYESAEGVTVTDVDGNDYVDMAMMGVGPCVLGYADADVDGAAKGAIAAGTMSTLNPPEEVELAETLLDLHPWGDMVRFGRPGGEAVAIAVRLARACSGNDTVAFCGYHGWHDWYLAANLAGEGHLDEHLLPGLDPKGVPEPLSGTARPFYYNDIETLEAIASESDLGAIVMEPIRHAPPEDGFLERVRELATRTQTPLIFDEVTAGFRMALGGAHKQLGVTPDVAVFGKAMANGYPMAAVVGREFVMDEAQETFVSSTFWTERIGPATSLATIEKMERERVPSHLARIGEQVMTGWAGLADDHGIEIEVKGPPSMPGFGLEYENGQAVRTLFTQEMLRDGFLAFNAMYPSYAHADGHVEAYLEAVDEVFASLRTHVDSGTVEDALIGDVAQTKFERLT